MYALILALSSTVRASAIDESIYFIFEGNPVAVKYISGRLVRLPIQDAYDIKSLKALESVSALMRAPRLTSLSTLAEPSVAHVSPPRMPEYGVAMFDVSIESSVAQKARPAPLVWSGPTRFREIVLSLPGVDSHWKRSLVDESRLLLAPALDFRASEKVGRQLEIDGPVSVRDYGRAAGAPHLAFVDITWRIKDLPEALSNNGIDSWSPFMRVEYVVNTRTGITVYRNTTNVGGIEDRGMRLFKEPGGPLLMAVTLGCTDGGEPLILDLEHESYGTGRPGDVPEIAHCFPAQ
jgi:hypothetical protein